MGNCASKSVSSSRKAHVSENNRYCTHERTRKKTVLVKEDQGQTDKEVESMTEGKKEKKV